MVKPQSYRTILFGCIFALALVHFGVMDAFQSKDANWDLLNYHFYAPSSIISGSIFTDLHPAGVQSYIFPLQDLIWFPVLAYFPATVATLFVVLVNVLVFIPLSLVIGNLSLNRTFSKLDIFFMIGSLSFGAMFITEISTTMGDILPSIPMLFSLNLLLKSYWDQDNQRSLNRKLILAGLLAGLGLALKATSVIFLPVLAVVLVGHVFAKRFYSVLWFVFSLAGLVSVLYSGWGAILFAKFGNPFFPFGNSIFRSPYFPETNFADERFKKSSFWDLISLPVAQASGVSGTAEIAFYDSRWAVLSLLTVVFFVVYLRFVFLHGFSESKKLMSRHLLAFVAIGFWCSYLLWAWFSGIQRYVLILELLAGGLILVLAIELFRLVDRNRISTVAATLGVFLLVTTRGIDFGSAEISSHPVVSGLKVPALIEFDNIVLAEQPLAVLSAFNRNKPDGSAIHWLGAPFNENDQRKFDEIVAVGGTALVFFAASDTDRAKVAGSMNLSIIGDCVVTDSGISSSILGPGSVLIEYCPAESSG